MTIRSQKKQASLERILDVASRKLREEGLSGAAIAPVMAEAGLTHGTFYTHFDNKDALANEAFRHALRTTQPAWLKSRKESWRERLKRLAGSYLSPRHRDARGEGCALSALVADVPTASGTFRSNYSSEVIETLCKIAELEDHDVNDPRFDQAITLLSLCIGGLSLARAVDDPTLSNRILKVCRAQFH